MMLSSMLRQGTRLLIRPHRFPDDPPLSQPVVFLVRHRNLKGPLDAFVSLPKVPHIWVLDCFFTFKECYEQYRCHTFSKRQGKNPKVFSLKALAAASVVVPIIKACGAIPVYRGKRKIRVTFDRSLELLKNGESIVIAVDKDYTEENSTVEEIYSGFFRLEKYYRDDTGEHLPFVTLHFTDDGSIVRSETMIFSEDRSFHEQQREFVANIIDFFNESSSLCNIPSSSSKSL